MNQESILTVSLLTASIKGTLEKNFPFVWVKGQIANLSRPSSGHVYFSLKDEHASIAAVWFKGNQKAGELFDPLTGEVFEGGPREPLVNLLENGKEFICAGKLTVYGARGAYQLVVELAQEAGIGHLHAEFERLKEKLARQGYFSLERKRVLPTMPHRVAVVTAASGAAIHDFISIASERGFGTSIRIYPSKVQGIGAAKEIIKQMDVIQQEQWAQVVVLIRGGGSLEDLWQFNEEVLATAIKNSSIPVIAGIGHEVDFTLADMTADVRAATPSHVAQILWPDRRELVERTERTQSRLENIMAQTLNNHEQWLDDMIRHLNARSPLRMLETYGAELKGTIPRLAYAFDRLFQRHCNQLHDASQILYKFLTVFEKKRDSLSLRIQYFESLQERWMDNLQRDLERVDLNLLALDPMRPLERGYSIAYKSNGTVVKNILDVSNGEKLSIRVGDGTIETSVRATTGGKTP